MRTRGVQCHLTSQSDAGQSQVEPGWHVSRPLAPGVPVSSVFGKEGSCLNPWSEPCGDAWWAGRNMTWVSCKDLCTDGAQRPLLLWATGPWGPPHPGVKIRGHVPSSRGPHWLAQGRRAENMLEGIGGAPGRTGGHEAQDCRGSAPGHHGSITRPSDSWLSPRARWE